MPGSSGESERHCGLLEEAEDFRPPQHLQSQQDQLCGDTDATSLSGACPALPTNVAKVLKPSKGFCLVALLSLGLRGFKRHRSYVIMMFKTICFSDVCASDAGCYRLE